MALPNFVFRPAYRLQQASIRYSLLGAQAALRAVVHGGRVAKPDAVAALRAHYDALLERDLQNVEEGIYPAHLLFQALLGSYLRKIPQFLGDGHSFGCIAECMSDAINEMALLFKEWSLVECGTLL